MRFICLLGILAIGFLAESVWAFDDPDMSFTSSGLTIGMNDSTTSYQFNELSSQLDARTPTIGDGYLSINPYYRSIEYDTIDVDIDVPSNASVDDIHPTTKINPRFNRIRRCFKVSFKLSSWSVIKRLWHWTDWFVQFS